MSKTSITRVSGDQTSAHSTSKKEVAPLKGPNSSQTVQCIQGTEKNQIVWPFSHCHGSRWQPFSCFCERSFQNYPQLVPSQFWLSDAIKYFCFSFLFSFSLTIRMQTSRLQFYLAAEIKMWSQISKLSSQHLFHGMRKAWGKKNKKKIKINKIRKPWKAQPPAMRDFNKHSELVSMMLRLYLSEGTKCQSGFSLLEAGTQVSMETRRRWRVPMERLSA